ncbi:MAG: hypothetical protein GF355_06945 [Candidatus Eisenbacteria bacterium]|nr:hypothetical protein [Candidatus Eisenbacteria bacterium]
MKPISRGATWIAAAAVGLALWACSDDGSTGSTGGGNGDEPVSGYLIIANFEGALVDGGTFGAAIMRGNPEDPSAKDWSLRVNEVEIPLLSLASTDDEAVYLKADFGYEGGQSYTVAATLNGATSTCSFTAPDYTWVTLTEPSGTTFQPGEPIELAWIYDGDTPEHVYVEASAGSDGEDELLFSEELDGAATTYTISGSRTSQWGVFEDVLITVDLGERIWFFDGPPASQGSAVTLVLPGDAEVLYPGDGDDPPEETWFVTLWLEDYVLDADGSSSTQLHIMVENQDTEPCPDGTQVALTAEPAGRLLIDPAQVTASAGAASAEVTAGDTAGDVTITAAALDAAGEVTLSLSEVITADVGTGPTPQIDWSPPSAMYGLVIRQEGISAGNLRWSLVAEGLGGFTPPVAYGEPPAGAQQIYPLGGGEPEALAVGEAHQLALVDAQGDTTYVEFTP